jgi:hypothetical protein
MTLKSEALGHKYFCAAQKSYGREQIILSQYLGGRRKAELCRGNG